MSILVWNCWGFANIEMIKYLFGLVKKYRLCIFLFEIKDKLGNLVKFVKKWRFDNFEMVEAKRKARGLLWLWKDEIDVEVVWKIENVVSTVVKGIDKQES